MDEIEKLQDQFPGTTITQVHCGAKVTSFILRITDTDDIGAEVIEELLESETVSGTTTLYSIKNFLESAGLHVLPINADMKELNRNFTSFIGVASTSKNETGEERFVDSAMNASNNRTSIVDMLGNGSSNRIVHSESGGHYIVIIKNGNKYIVVDPPIKSVVEVNNDDDLQQFAADYGYSGNILIVSKTPIELPSADHSNWDITSPLTAFVIVGVLLISFFKLGRRTKKG